jgi:hypothetical protein
VVYLTSHHRYVAVSKLPKKTDILEKLQVINHSPRRPVSRRASHPSGRFIAGVSLWRSTGLLLGGLLSR